MVQSGNATIVLGGGGLQVLMLNAAARWGGTSRGLRCHPSSPLSRSSKYMENPHMSVWENNMAMQNARAEGRADILPHPFSFIVIWKTPTRASHDSVEMAVWKWQCGNGSVALGGATLGALSAGDAKPQPEARAVADDKI